MRKGWLSFVLVVAMIFGQVLPAGASADTGPPVTEPDLKSGVYGGPIVVTLTASENATIYYTLDGSEPTESHFQGSGPHSGVYVPLTDFYNELRYRAIDQAGNKEDVRTEFYKIASPDETAQVIPGTDAYTYYTHYVAVDGDHVVYAKRVKDGFWWGYFEVYLIQSGLSRPIALGLDEEIEYTGIWGDHVIYGGASTMYHYSISNDTTEVIYTSEDYRISNPKIHGNRIVFVDDYELVTLDITNPGEPVQMKLDADMDYDVYPFYSYDVYEDLVVWEEGGHVYLADLSESVADPQPIHEKDWLNHIVLTDTHVYLEDDNNLYSYEIQTGNLYLELQHVRSEDSGALWPYYSDMKIDKAGKSHLIFRGYSDSGAWIGVLNLQTKVVKYLDFAGDYTQLLGYDIHNGVAYWSKAQYYFDEDDIYVEKTPIYSLDLKLLTDSVASQISLAPTTAIFEWEGTVSLQVNEEMTIYYTLDGSEPSPTHGYAATLFDKIPVIRDETHIKWMAVDYYGNHTHVQTSGPYQVIHEALPITDGEFIVNFALAHSKIVYLTYEDDVHHLYLYDIPGRRHILLDDDFPGFEFEFDGQYIVYEDESSWDRSLHYIDLSTGQTGMIAEEVWDFSLNRGVVLYEIYNQEEEMSRLELMQLSSGEQATLPLQDPNLMDKIESVSFWNTYILIVTEEYIIEEGEMFGDWIREYYLYLPLSGELRKLELPDDIYEIAGMGDSLYIIPDDRDRLAVYEIHSDSFASLTASDPNVWLSDLTVDRIYGKYVLAYDDEHDKILLYHPESGQSQWFGSGYFYSYGYQLSGDVLVNFTDYGFMQGDQLFMRILPNSEEPSQIAMTPEPGLYRTSQTVTFDVYDQQVSVWYTLDGSTPTFDSHLYMGPITISQNAELQYIAVDVHGHVIATGTGSYVIDDLAPEVYAAPAGGFYPSALTVYLHSNEPSAIYYSLDESEPSVIWSVYEQEHGMVIAADTVLKFKAVDQAGNVSETKTEQYVIVTEAPGVSVTPAGGLYHQDITVTMSVYDNKTAVDIYYTLDGTEPTEQSTKYTSPFTISETAVLKYFAVDEVGNRTPVMSIQYEIDKTPPQAIVYPADNSRKVRTDTPITATFDVEVTANRLEGVQIMREGISLPNVTAALEGRELKIYHDEFEKGTTYVVMIPADTVRNVHGIGNEVIHFSFTTEFRLPSATLTPANGAVNIALEAPVTVAFSEPVTAGDLAGVRIMRDGQELSGVSATLDHQLLTIAHDRFEYNKTYQVVVPADTVFNADGQGNVKIEWAFTTMNTPVYIGGGGSTAPQQPDPQFEVGDNEIVLGSDSYERTTGTTEDGRSVSTVSLNEDFLSKALGLLKEQNAEAPAITVNIEDADDITEVNLPAHLMSQAASDLPNASLSIRTGQVTYELPLKLFLSEAFTSILGDGARDQTIQVSIAKVSDDTAQQIASAAEAAGIQILGEAIEFRIHVMSGDSSTEIKDFGNIYVTRTIILSGSLDSSTASVVMVDPETGEWTFVPAVFAVENGNTVVTMKRNGNSIYAVVSAEKSFDDIIGHWAAADIQLLASKLLVKGTSASAFSPDNKISRAEFAALIVRALGLSQHEAAASFYDIASSDWFAGSVGAAVKAGIVNGFADNTFRPHHEITREEMAVMVSRALAFIQAEQVSSADAEIMLAKFNDRDEISDWAREGVAQAVHAGIIHGKSEHAFVPNESATRAEAAVMLKRMLLYVGFIN